MRSPRAAGRTGSGIRPGRPGGWRARGWRARGWLVAVVAVLLAAAPALRTPTLVAARAPLAQGRDLASVPGVQVGRYELGLLSQPAWVGPRGDFVLQLELSAPAPSRDTLQLSVYPRLYTLTGFESSLSGRFEEPPVYQSAPVRLSSLPPDPAGGVELVVPVNEPATTGGLPELHATGGSQVFPVQLRLFNPAGVPEGGPLTTYLVYSAGSPAGTGFPRLDVALTVPVGVPPAVGRRGRLTAPPARTVDRLAEVVSDLASHPGVPVSLEVTPETADSLALGGSRAKAVLSGLVSLVQGGEELLPSPYVQVSLPGLEAAGLAAQVSAELAMGSAALGADLHRSPTRATWVVDGPLDNGALEAMIARGASRVVLPPGDLSQLPEADRQTTFGQVATLLGPGGHRLEVMESDGGAAALFSGKGGPVLEGYRILAELAMIQLEDPSESRGVAVVPPPSWQVDPSLLGVVLSGLQGNPLLQPLSVDDLFASVPHASGVDLSLTPVRPAALPGGQALRSLAERLSALRAVFPGDHGQALSLERQLLAATASGLGPGQRKALLEAGEAQASTDLRRVALPGSASVTLTASKAQVPLTILSDPAHRADVVLRLTSQKLIFRHFRPPGGACSVPVPTSEMCSLSLVSQDTTLRVPVETRTAGVFPLEVELLAPGSGQVLARDRYTIRSTAVSGVGVVLMAAATFFLAVWWVRNIRHGRRARQLLPPPEEEDAVEPGPTPGGQAATAPADDRASTASTASTAGVASVPDRVRGAGEGR